MKRLLIILTVFLPIIAVAQFAPPAGQIGSSAIPADSSIFIQWAKDCSVTRGLQEISIPENGYTSVGDSSLVLGQAVTNGVVSLGDGGTAIVSFQYPIINGPGADFAVFENSFSDTFLELAFVEVSSDGQNYFRFPATSLTQDTAQIDGFGIIDATKINNFAGKYRAGYGTPFDLEELKNIPQLNINSITHVKIIDVVGNISNEFTTYDAFGNKVNDPWPTPFPSGGFDLDAVGVIHQAPANVEAYKENLFIIYPNPTKDKITIKNCENYSSKLVLKNATGMVLYSEMFSDNFVTIDLNNYSNGIYFVTISTIKGEFTEKIVVLR